MANRTGDFIKLCRHVPEDTSLLRSDICISINGPSVAASYARHVYAYSIQLLNKQICNIQVKHRSLPILQTAVYKYLKKYKIERPFR